MFGTKGITGIAACLVRISQCIKPLILSREISSIWRQWESVFSGEFLKQKIAISQQFPMIYTGKILEICIQKFIVIMNGGLACPGPDDEFKDIAHHRQILIPVIRLMDDERVGANKSA